MVNNDELMSQFDNLMHYSGNIKSAQLAEKRKKFDQMPSFIQAGLFLFDKYKNVRNQDLVPKLFVFDILKNEGNSLFGEGKFDEAARRYEEALSIFRCLYSLSSRWREEGIDDQFIQEVETKGNNAQENSKINSFKLLCYLNLAACYIKVGNFKTAIDACDEALHLDSSNVKALYRRAKARMLLNKDDMEGISLALSDYNSAQRLDPSNDLVKKEYKEAQGILKALEKKKQQKEVKIPPILMDNAKEKYYDEKDVLEEIPEIATLNETIAKGENAIQILESMGKFDVAAEQRENIEKIKHAKQCLLQLVNMDLEKPRERMKDQAKQLGITFSDEEIMRDLEKMKRNNLNEARDLIRSSLGLPKREEKKESETKFESKLEEDKQDLIGNKGVFKPASSIPKDEQIPESIKNTPLPKETNSETVSVWQSKADSYILYGGIFLIVVAVLVLIISSIYGSFQSSPL